MSKISNYVILTNSFINAVKKHKATSRVAMAM